MNVVFLDCTQNYGYQFSAANTKIELMAKGLSMHGDNCTIINSIMGFEGVCKRTSLYKEEIGKVITYKSFKFPEITSIINLQSLYKDLKSAKAIHKQNILVLVSQYIHIYYTYICIGKLLGYKVVVISHEWLPTIKRKHFIQNLSAKLYGKYFGYGVDAILPISHYIQEKITKFHKKELLTPVLAAFPEELSTIPKHKKDTLVYCVMVYYRRVIDMIINAYDKYQQDESSPLELNLILSGPQNEISKVSKYIHSRELSSKVKILSKLPYEDLIKSFMEARALIIPLDPKHEQDKARFSQKIAEYISTGVPIITNNVGEIPYYFKNRENALICDYSEKGFSESFKWIQKNKTEASFIGYNGYKTGKKYFDHKSFCAKLHSFFTEL